MHIKSVEVPSPPIGEKWKFEEGVPAQDVEENAQCRLLFSLFQDFPEVINSIVVVKIPTLLTSAWFGSHSKTIALRAAHFFKRSLMADVGIGPLSFSSCSEGDTFRCISLCSSFKISWEFLYRQFIFMSQYELVYVILVHLQFQISSSQNFIHNLRGVSLITSEYVFVVLTQKIFLESVRYPNTKIFRESVL
ncbi:uncharacterized protein TNCV_789201 [Trichonephila clavipes]|nr:uncharacterized protein TNCV_789201 [Trichonephila clavipes]